MLQINRVKIEIITDNGVYGSDTFFGKGLTFLSSDDNTCGKSSILAAVYYCLGLEEILGGRGEKVLTSVFKTTIEDGNKTWRVIQSSVCLEISNGKEVITLFRSAKMENRDSHMITVYYGKMDEISNPKVESIDTYVHLPNAARNELGFHSVLEKFLFLDLPNVTATDNTQRKLYMQLIFAGMFIEQKHGWSDLFSGMPILGIRESKKRVIEYILKLDTLENDKKREQLKIEEFLISNAWEECYKDLQVAATRESCTIINFPGKPRLLSDDDISRIIIRNSYGSINDIILDLERQVSEVKQLKPRVIDNFDALQNELSETESEIIKLSKHVHACREQLNMETESIRSIKENLETVAIDLSNNKDAARLRKLGSELQFEFADERCPVCHQKITDSLLPHSIDTPVMSIDDNIRHLEAQKDMLEFSLASHTSHKDNLEKEIQTIESRLFTLRRLAQSIRNDLFSINEDYSEAVVYKKITLEKQIDALKSLELLQNEINDRLRELSKRWESYLVLKSQLPTKGFTEKDFKKLDLLKKTFIDNLRKFGYKSIHNLDEIEISHENYLPLFEGFDMKFDSSASDNIRVIWAFTLALLEVSIKTDGNHPCVLIFDEPDQQSTIITDMEAFFSKVLQLAEQSQIIIGITLKDRDTRQAVENLPEDKYTRIIIPNKAFQFMKKSVT